MIINMRRARGAPRQWARLAALGAAGGALLPWLTMAAREQARWVRASGWVGGKGGGVAGAA